MRSANVTPVAVIGMACRLPGGIDSPQRLWEALLRGDDLVTEIPKERWDADLYYDPEPGVPGRSVSRWGAFLDDVGGFDCDFFGMTEREATAIDPQHRLLLETSWDAIEHAGLDPATLAGSQTGVFIGLTHGDYELLSADCGAAEGPYGFTATSNSFASGRVAYTLGLHGPAVTVDTACSSGLTAIHQACGSLDGGESDLALAGGVAVTLEPRKSVSGSLQGMLSPTGRCHAFDVAADGFVSGEGCVVLLLKRLPDAERDGDRILAVLRGTAANQDGRTPNIAAPSEQAQVAVYRKALAVAGVDPATVGLVEAHGTGTQVGDPIEFASLAAVYGTAGRCALASVKTNFGHMQSTSGPLGMMKAILALQHGVVPKNLYFTRLPDQLAEITTELFVPQDSTTWPVDGEQPRRAAVSSYGISGTNVHAILEEAPAASGDSAKESPAAAKGDGPLLFAVSATSAEQLHATAARLADWVDEHGSRTKRAGLWDLGYTLSRRRGYRPVRTMVPASSVAELSRGLREIAGSEIPYQPAVGQDDRGPVWVFSGQGSQWAGMGAELLAKEPVFAATIAAMEPVIAEESGFSVTEALTAAEKVTGINRVQPTIFAIQVALAAAMKSYGVYPGAVIGHSLGEAAAAVVAGALSFEDGLRVICRRSRLMSRVAGSGAMASVELPGQQVLSELSIRGLSDVVLAVVASPTSTVVGGDTQAIRDLVAAWQEQDVMAREVAVDVASHTPQVEPILDDLVEALADLKPTEPEIPYYSATLWNPRERPSFTGEYWAENLRYTVRFAAAVQAALKDGFRVFGELAPHPLLTYAIEQNAASLDMPISALAAMRREQELPFGLRGFVADVHSAGALVDFSVQYPDGCLVDAPLPTWTHRELMLSRESADHPAHGAAVQAVHPLLGAHVHLFEEPERHVWQGGVGTEAHPWLGDHQIHNVAALPGAAYCEMALAAARATLGEASEVRDIKFEQTLLLDDETMASSAATVSAPGVLEFAVETHEEGERVRRASAVLHALEAGADLQQPPAHNIDALIASHPSRMEGADLRTAFDAVGIQYGPAFSGLAAVHTVDGTNVEVATVLAEVALPGAIRSQQSAYTSHPALLDACFQSVIVAPEVQKAGAGGLLLPVGVRRLRNYHSMRNAQYCLTRVTASRAGECEVDLEVLDQSGTVLLLVEGLRLAGGASEHEHANRVLDERLFTVEWEPRELPEVTQRERGSWLVLGASDPATLEDPLAKQLGDALNADGGYCTAVPLPLGQIDTAQLRSLLSGDGVSPADGHGALKGLTGVVVVTAPPAAAAGAGAESPALRRGRDYVSHIVTIAREISELPGERPRLFVVTRNAASIKTGDLANLEQAGLRGLMRVIDSEHPYLSATQIDVDGTNHATIATHVARQLHSGSDEDETGWRDGEWYTARLRPGPVSQAERRTAVVQHERDGMRLEIRTPGDLESLEFVAFDRVPPGPGEIEVAVTASTINFADVLVAFGRYPTFEGYRQLLGIDFAGVVSAVGPGVTEHKVGDRVGGMSRNGCWTTFVICDARHAVTLPPEVPLEEAAAVPTVAATAWYGLHDLARISSTDKVLIHSGTGGVGQAAIAIARAAGCEIFATAGSPQRRQLLRDMGIEHVYDSRSLEFAEQIRRDTKGYGVDVVLNSLPGAAQRAGIELLAFGGRFVEIGKRDIYGDTRLGLFPFRRNLSLYAVDLALLTHTHPETVRRLLTTVYQRTAEGVLPVPQTTHYPIHDAAGAVRLVAGARHTGKVLLDVPHTGSSVAVVPPEQVRAFRADGAYIVTGGLTGLGLFLGTEMAAAGCGRVVLNSRSAPNPQAQQTIERLRAKGADIQVECGDIAEPGVADRLVAVATQSGLPVRGVLHAAGVVEDATLTNVTDELIDRCWAPKVYGAWNLHVALKEVALQEGKAAQPLDWFCSFSTAAALVGSPGQGAYAAANSWLDGFSHWRRAQGLPSTAIAWGAWGEIGLATALAEMAGAAIAPAEGARVFQTLLCYSRPYSCYAPIMGTPWLTSFAQRSRFAEAFQSISQGQKDKSKFLAELKVLPRDEWPSMIRRLVSEQISLLLRRTIDPDRPLSDYGLDSLGNLELRTRIETETGVRISPTKITTIRGLAEHLCEELAAMEAESPAS
ncbi:mycocerosic acid synthase (polyketide synthase) [Mycobacterium haemophilum DSM 44634]|uniref:sulfolipid-1 biosynthesis phthioceranic/hydroxyphthioceranic acid synthase n=1 Tax=Mycobacterium haemophilum TaxID=29311 RepID=UPI00065567B3|nr:type I polyketide synthase [Mycobacterium haemophilum]AKN16434.1 polyketide synthase [Mycobacterium haemophilum DSM 44634]MCV7341455.1 type I polyketide synthase [Mycobacterium haemophilum DSM 44634]